MRFESNRVRPVQFRESRSRKFASAGSSVAGNSATQGSFAAVPAVTYYTRGEIDSSGVSSVQPKSSVSCASRAPLLMQVVETALREVLVLEPRVFEDERGFFFESYNQRVFQARTGLSPRFVQNNHSRSKRDVLRGLHYQIAQPQAKLVRVVAGAVFDVAVDLRKSSPAFGKWTGTTLSAENRRMVWIPEGFGHGFLVLSDFADFLYQATDYYAPEHERCVIWNDPEIDIQWPLKNAPVLAPKDRVGLPLRQAETFP